MTLLHLAVALDGAGRHPAAWRDPGAHPSALFTAGYWAGLVTEAEQGLLDFVTFEDALGPAGRTEQVRGRLDAVLVAARVAPLTSRIGLVPTADTIHTEPFHVAIGIATLDHVSRGRAGWRPHLCVHPADAAHFGRRSFPELSPEDLRGPKGRTFLAERFSEAADAVEVARRLWDSWEDDAEIRDVATGRFLDRDKLHYIDFEGPYFSVRGPSITPRPPQGQPPVAVSARDALAREFAVRAADIVHIAPRSRAEAETLRAQVRAAEHTAGRTGPPLKVFADLVVFLDRQAGAAADRKAGLDDLAGAEPADDVAVFTGTPAELANLLLEWREAGLDGFRLHPGVLPTDLTGITRGLVPELQRRGAFRTGYLTGTLRDHLGLPRPANRYATAP